jgi:diaminopimelate epimerase
MPLPFVKAAGTGNNFVVVDLRPGQPATGGGRSPQDPATAREICDRHFGVCADGVLAILPSTSGDARMRMLNADDSEAEMSGNGLRCVAKVLYESDPALRRPTLEERLAPGAQTTVHLPGGTLAITVAPDYTGVRLRCPARIAFCRKPSWSALGPQTDRALTLLGGAVAPRLRLRPPGCNSVAVLP